LPVAPPPAGVAFPQNNHTVSPKSGTDVRRRNSSVKVVARADAHVMALDDFVMILEIVPERGFQGINMGMFGL